MWLRRGGSTWPFPKEMPPGGGYRAVFEMKRCCLKDIGAKLFPCLGFGEDAMAKRARAIATFLSVANFED